MKQFFRDFDAPGMNFKFDKSDKSTYTYYAGILTVFDQNLTQNRNFYASQALTPAGLMRAEMSGVSSSLDGLNKAFVTPEGSLNLETLASAVKSTSGKNAAEWASHVAMMRMWDWSDCHTPLLVNMLRFVMLRRMGVEWGDFNLKLKKYDDGHVQIDRNQWWPKEGDKCAEGYEEKSEWDKHWPSYGTEQELPEVTRLTGNTPDTDDSVIDLRGFNQNEARWIVAMLAPWERRSRFRLDFKLPRLADIVRYRCESEIGNIKGHFCTPTPSQTEPEPQLPTWSEAWEALKKYVTKNRVYSDFSSALYIVVGAMYQMLPATAEANYWLSINWNVSIPSFHSIRGRYQFLNQGEGALVSQRALSEWTYVVSRIEKINLMAAVFVQAYQTGMAVRSVRHGLELSPTDLFCSENEFTEPHNMLSAAAAEATRSMVPLSGQLGCYINTDTNFEVFDANRQVATLNTDITGIDGYDFVDPVQGSTTYSIRAPRITFAGVPVLILPLNPFPYNSPFTMKGCIEEAPNKVDRKGLRTNITRAWEIANLYRLCGYDTNYDANVTVAGPSEWFAPNDAQMVWPVMIADDDQDEIVTIEEQPQRDNHFISLASTSSMAFKKQKYEYSIRINRRGSATGAATGRSEIAEYSGVMRMTTQATVTYQIPDAIARLRGYISRNEQGFQFVEAVQAGVIPTVEGAGDVTGVAG